jgi:hypothetical protein
MSCGCGPKLAPGTYPDYDPNRKIGHPLTVWPGWVDNDARYSVQTDIIPIPISPVHFQNWTEMNYQLSNGWQLTNYGARMPEDDYLRMLYSSNSSPGYPKPMPGERVQPTANGLVSQKTLQNTMLVSNIPDNTNGAGVLNPGVSLAGRTYFG